MKKRFAPPQRVWARLAALVALPLAAVAGLAQTTPAPRQSAPASTRVSAASPENAPGVMLEVPYVKQEKNACGAAVLSMVMQYWTLQQNRSPSPRAAQPAILRALDPGPRGIANTALESYLRDSGFKTFAFSGRWSDLAHHLTRGRPLIVGLGPEQRGGPLHYVVVAGIDWQHGLIFLNDPARRKLFPMSRERFEREWRATDDWTLLALPASHG